MREIKGQLIPVAIEKPVRAQSKFLSLVVEHAISFVWLFDVSISSREFQWRGYRINPVVEKVSRLKIGTRQVALGSFDTICNKLAMPFLLNRKPSVLKGKFLQALLDFKLIVLRSNGFGKAV